MQALLAGSVDKTLAAKNAKISLDFSGSVAGQNLSFGGTGVADFVGKKFDLKLTLPAEAGISGTIEERVIGKAIYVMLPAAESAVTGGKQWIKLDLSELGASDTTGLNLTGTDPTQLLTTLRGVSDSVTKVGTAEVRGVQTTHYRAEVNLAKAVKASGADSSNLDQLTKALGATTLPEDIYLDSSGLARRFSVTMKPAAGTATGSSTSAPTTAATGSFTVTVDFYDFGTTDTSGITAPPANEVGTLPTGTPSASATG
ncbi:MAG TPA: hypothetical protein VHX15_11110 [Frankiaceae bacterium]|nr:hypothetical protein [Frankiaceae bacterium]